MEDHLPIRVSPAPLRRIIEETYPEIRRMNKPFSEIGFIAELASVSKRTIQRVMSDDNTVTLNTADKICTGLGVPTAYVLGEEYERN